MTVPGQDPGHDTLVFERRGLYVETARVLRDIMLELIAEALPRPSGGTAVGSE